MTETPIFFMHIAKTAGSYVNEVFEEALGREAVAKHVEHRMGNTEDLRAILSEGKAVVSGHVMNALWSEIVRPLDQPFRKVTVLRDPIEHLASHIHWFDRYNRPDRRVEYRHLDEKHQRIVDRVGAIDLGDVAQLDDFLTTLGASEIRLFDNCQSRYFLSNGRNDHNAFRPLSLLDAREVRRVAEEFDFIACQDRLDADLAILGRSLNLPLRPTGRYVNAADALRKIDTSHPTVRRVLSKRLLLDDWLWRWRKGDQR